MTARTPAERSKAYRDRKRGGPPRTRPTATDPLNRARRKLKHGARRTDLAADELKAIRTFERERRR